MAKMTPEQTTAYDVWWIQLSRQGDPAHRADLVADAFAAGWAAREAAQAEVSPAPLEYQPMEGMTGISGNYHMEALEGETVIITPDGKHRFSIDPRVSMWEVHIIAEAHRDGVLLGAASAGAAKTTGGEGVPPGVIAILTDKRGEVVATAMDFETAGFGGYTLEDAQRVRARVKIAAAAANAYCVDALQEALSGADLDRLLIRLLERADHKITYVPVGHAA